MAAGVYCIYCKPTKRFYVGQSSCIPKRWGWHRHQLRHNRHSVPALQLDWNTHGEDKFQFRVLETEGDKNARLAAEAEWIARLQAVVTGYNIAESGSAKRQHTPETKALMSVAAKLRNADPSYNKMISDRCKKQHAEGTLNITAASQKKAADARRGIPMSEANKQKLRDSALARREQMREAARKSVLARGFTLKR